MDTYVIQRDIKDDDRICYYLIPGNTNMWAKCSMSITNPEIVRDYAATFTRNGHEPFKYVLKNVVLSTGEFEAYEDVEILSFELSS